MRLMVNGLSVTNTSGAQVLLGHLQQMTEVLGRRVQLIMLVRAVQRQTFAAVSEQAEWCEAPDYTEHWLGRAVWERWHLPKVVVREGPEIYFSPSGYALAHLRLPQVIFCQNPWAFVRAARRRRDAPKAWLQRRAYAGTMDIADTMVFNSRYMQDAYREHAGQTERRGVIAYQAPDPATLERTKVLPLSERVPGQLLCVSVMGPHKNVEAILRAVQQLRTDPAMKALRLHVVGSWPDRAYEDKILGLIKENELGDCVELHGFVDREELERLYAESMAFILMSRCESFGIPAIEAQCFGTPVISSDVCAIPEVCGDGGVYHPPDDVSAIARSIKEILTDQDQWTELSTRAQQNAAKYVWSSVSRPLVDLIESYIKD